MEAIHVAPRASDFVSITTHQSQTPGTFFGGKPVLHLHCPHTLLKLSRADLSAQPALAVLQVTQPNATENGGGEDDEVTINGVDVWITSEHFILFSSTTSAGVQIVYPSISLHAQQGNSIYLELCLSDLAQTADEDLEVFSLSLVPTSASTEPPGIYTEAGSAQPPVEESPAEPLQANGDGPTTVETLFNAISVCQELHPDPDSDDDQGNMETMPGAGGWITSDNMDQFMDEDGNFRMPEGVPVADGAANEHEEGTLGEGAGRFRSAAEIDVEDGADEEETKWIRTA